MLRFSIKEVFSGDRAHRFEVAVDFAVPPETPAKLLHFFKDSLAWADQEHGNKDVPAERVWDWFFKANESFPIKPPDQPIWIGENEKKWDAPTLIAWVIFGVILTGLVLGFAYLTNPRVAILMTTIVLAVFIWSVWAKRNRP